MVYKLQGGIFRNVIPSDNYDIALPAYLSGTNSSAVAGTLTDNTKDFVALGVKVNDIVYNTTDSTASIVTKVAATALTLKDNIFTAAPKTYELCSATGDTPVFYVTGGGTLVVQSGGYANWVTFTLSAASFVPVQARKVGASSTATGIIAIW